MPWECPCSIGTTWGGTCRALPRCSHVPQHLATLPKFLHFAEQNFAWHEGHLWPQLPRLTVSAHWLHLLGRVACQQMLVQAVPLATCKVGANGLIAVGNALGSDKVSAPT